MRDGQTDSDQKSNAVPATGNSSNSSSSSRTPTWGRGSCVGCSGAFEDSAALELDAEDDIMRR